MSAIGPIALNIFIPSMPGLANALNTDFKTAQLTLTFFLVSLAVSQLIIGPLSDRIGRRPVFLAGMVLFIAASLACAFAETIGQLIIGRIVQAAGGCTGLVLARAIIRDLYDRDEAASNIAYVTMAMVVAPMVAPTIGGYLDDWTGWRGGFYFTAAAAGIVLIAAIFRLYETNPYAGTQTDADPFTFFRKSAQLMKEPAFIGYAFNLAFGSGCFFAFLAGAPYIVISIFGGTAGDYGNYFILTAFSYMFGNFISGRFSRRVGANRMIMMGSALSLLGLGVMLTGALSGGFNIVWLFGAMSIIAVSNGLTIPNATAAAISVRPDIPGTGAGLSGFYQIGLGALATYLVGVLHDGTYWPMIYVMVGAGSLSFLFMLMALKTSKKQAA